jgi:hypothetical protein
MFNKFVKSILKESGLQNEGFVHKDKEIFISPVKDLYRGFLFNKSHDHFYLHLVVTPVYSPLKHLPLTYGWRISTTPYREMFMWDKEKDNTEVKAEVIQLLQESKKFLLDINTPLDFYNRFKDFDKEKFSSVDTYHHQKTIAYTLCYAGQADCCKVIDEALQHWETSDRKQLPWMQEIAANLRKLKSVCSDNNKKEQLFNEWKLATIKNLRLEKYQPTETRLGLG